MQDPIKDDQSIVFLLKEKGLVVISGCSHAGIINTIRHAKKQTGVKQVHAVLGGFHLSGADKETIVKKTLEELKVEDPEVIVPMHYAGWEETHYIVNSFSDAFVLNSVGSKITLS